MSLTTRKPVLQEQYVYVLQDDDGRHLMPPYATRAKAEAGGSLLVVHTVVLKWRVR